MPITFKWSLSFGLMTAMLVFLSSIYVNSFLTSLFRSGFVFIIGLFIGLILHLIWGFIQMDIKGELVKNQLVQDKAGEDKSENTLSEELDTEEVRGEEEIS